MKSKKAALAVLGAALAMSATACGGNGNNENAGGSASGTENQGTASEVNQTGQAAKPVTLTIQYPKSDNPTGIANEENKIKRFTAQYPNVTLKKNDWEYRPNEIGIKMAAHQAPSFFNTYATEGKTLIEHRWLTDLTPFMAKYPHADEFNETLTPPFTIDGKLYGVPANGYVLTVTLNKKLFEAKNVPLPDANWDWDDFYAAASATADPAKGIAGFAIMAKGNEGGWNWTNFLYQAGGDVEKVEDGKVTSVFNSDAGVKAMAFLKKLRWEGGALPNNWALNHDDTYNLFKQGRAAIVLGNEVEDAVNNGGMKKEDLMVLPMPSMDKGGDHIGVMGGNYLVVNPEESPEVQQAAFDYITYNMFSDDGLTDLERVLNDRKSKGQTYVYGDGATYYKPDSDYGKKSAGGDRSIPRYRVQNRSASGPTGQGQARSAL
ncbi:ABC transporter substrate-binding protein [Cohnella rhizosphaerae]|uniref:ABC transporter substrate-binding protein n=1 Tax=Cohnella rhizosphaerae TaxID=1457232 RepID=A0A9X4QWH3_9BACL|nr:extracellular solute-binding protein [Cohnella rhizosphaerae]MDG0814481.1 ABC transporter substrate-binding protein [Cohnella rhizosphaerae]